MRLKTHITVGALLRRAQGEGLFAVVVHKGDPDGGLVFVKIRDGAKARLFAERYEGGFTERTDGFVGEAEADGIVAKERDFDRDLWLIEIEGRMGTDLLS